MNHVITEALVLRRIEYGEADRIVTLLTKDKGKLTVIAKGVRKPKSKLAGGVELFSISTITYIESRNEMKTLVSARITHDYSDIVKNAEALQTAYAILQAVHAYTESVCEDDYFAICAEALARLHAGVSPQTVGVWFGVRLLSISGHGINLHTDAHGADLEPNGAYMFDPASMSLVPHANGTITANHIKLLRLCDITDVGALLRIQNIQQLSEDVAHDVRDAVKYNSTQSL